ncbi:hypothetical protein P7F88_03535 [Vibrio hannami]|uniref:hypothetical protein n=1 Tax=Vibrio hannami TaxID=2717094 RepID=UPI0024101392|nr:hypothetical protein [Vibrio hannami]MDG3085221.1 hypothetical protein [Vibrio hannami]
MPVSSVQSGYSLIQQSQNLTKEAANEIAQQNSREDLEFNKLEQPSDVEKERELETSKENEKKKMSLTKNLWSN